MRYARERASERGVALVAALLFLMAMGVLSTALVFTVQSEMRSSASYKYGQQAFYVANAGIQRAARWFAASYTPWISSSPYTTTTSPVTLGGAPVLFAGQTGSTSNFPGQASIDAFTSAFSNRSLSGAASNAGVYAVNATLMRHQPVSFINPATFTLVPSAIERWKVASIGSWGSNDNPLGTAQITVMLENSGNAMFDRALWGISSVDLGGTVLIDSYDPTMGAYGGTNVFSHGSVGSNGSVSANGSVQIKGDLAFGPAGSYSLIGGATVAGDIIQLAEPRQFADIPAFTVGMSYYNPKNEVILLEPGIHGTVEIGPGGILELKPGVYYFDSITQHATASLRILGGPTDRTTIFVKNDLQLAGQGVVNLNGDPTRLTVFFTGSQMSLKGGAQAFFEVYAPYADVVMNGNEDFYGSFIGRTVTVGGTPQIHFNQGSLNSNMLPRPFRIITWTRNYF